MKVADYNNKLLFCADGDDVVQYGYTNDYLRRKNFPRNISLTSPMSMPIKSKQCTHEHAIRGKCMNPECGKENV